MKIPILYNLKGKKIIVVGGGLKAYLETRKLLKFGADLSLVSKAYNRQFDDLEKITKDIDILKHIDLDTRYFDNKDMVVIATGNKFLNDKIYEYCQKNHILTLFPDEIFASDVEIMESKRRNQILLATSTNGASSAFESEILENCLDALDDEVFTRLAMLIEEKRTLRGLTK